MEVKESFHVIMSQQLLLLMFESDKEPVEVCIIGTSRPMINIILQFILTNRMCHQVRGAITEYVFELQRTLIFYLLLNDFFFLHKLKT